MSKSDVTSCNIWTTEQKCCSWVGEDGIWFLNHSVMIQNMLYVCQCGLTFSGLIRQLCPIKCRTLPSIQENTCAVGI